MHVPASRRTSQEPILARVTADGARLSGLRGEFSLGGAEAVVGTVRQGHD